MIGNQMAEVVNAQAASFSFPSPVIISVSPVEIELGEAVLVTVVGRFLGNVVADIGVTIGERGFGCVERSKTEKVAWDRRKALQWGGHDCAL